MTGVTGAELVDTGVVFPLVVGVLGVRIFWMFELSFSGLVGIVELLLLVELLSLSSSF